MHLSLFCCPLVLEIWDYRLWNINLGAPTTTFLKMVKFTLKCEIHEHIC